MKECSCFRSSSVNEAAQLVVGNHSKIVINVLFNFGNYPILAILAIHQSRLIIEATYPAPKPLSIFTTLTFEAQEFSMPNSAARPLNDAP